MYMIVENDEYELPLAVFDTCKELAEHLGITTEGVRSRVRRGAWKTAKIVRVDEPDQKTAQREYQAEYRKTHDRREYFKQRYQKQKERKNHESI